MKKTFKTILATTMVTALCATSAIGISGISANAASADGNSQFAVQTDNFSKPALTDGGWHGAFNDGAKVRLHLDLSNQKATIYFDDGAVINYKAAFISAIGMYKFTDANGNIAQFKILENTGTQAVLKCGNRTLDLSFDGVNGTGSYMPALTDGGWHGSFNDGAKVRLHLDLSNQQATLYFDDGAVIRYHAAFISAISTYKLIDSNGNIVQFRVVENNGHHAALQCGNRILTLTFDGVNN